MTFTYDQIVEQRTVHMRGESLLRIHGGAFVSILAYAAPAAVFEDKRAEMVGLFDTFKVHPETLDPDNLKIDSLTRWRYPGGLFEINVPAGWRASDESTPGHVLVNFRDPAGRAGMVVEIVPAPKGGAKTSAQALLKAFVASGYAGLDQFQSATLRLLSADSADTTFKYRANLRGKSISVLGWCALRRASPLVATVRVLLPQSVASQLWSQVIDMGAGFALDATIALQ